MLKNKNKNRKLNNKNLTPAILILVGVLLFSFTSSYKLLSKYFPLQQTYVNEQKQVEEPIFYYPKRIVIPKIKIDISVMPGGFKDNQWILTDKAVHYVDSSGKLGESYNTIVYGHKRWGLFGNLYQLTKNDQIEVYDEKGQQFNFVVISKESVKPKAVEKLVVETPNSLTLFTCDGALDQSRLLIKAKLVEI